MSGCNEDGLPNFDVVFCFVQEFLLWHVVFMAVQADR